jgi:uncharacterized protein (DUF433 family)
MLTRSMKSASKTTLQEMLEMPNYSLIEASRYFHVPMSTVEYWTQEPNVVVELAQENPKMLSFKNLVEFYVLEGLRHIHGLKLPAIRTAIEDLKAHESSRHPLAEYDLSTINRKHLVFVRNGKIVNASLFGQYEIPEWTTPYLKRVERDPYGFAQKIFPFMKRSQVQADATPPNVVVIDPNICFGLPVLTGSRITTGFLAGRFKGGDRLSDIARSYGRPVGEIKEAIEWETGKRIPEDAAA